ncbi:zinc-dependent alcohol dehydrogenase [Actinophytocola sp.]|uniref:zinc-dependent alcohol dehydrogenase n=1 Tax=Actinophytocola sp. TaxID=1872138 RepID=UPI002ED96D2B
MTTTVTYRRAVLRGPGQLAVEDADLGPPAAGELLVAPDAVGICGTDLELLDGSMAYLQQGLAEYPIVPGHEWTGRVVAVGPDVTGFATGDRVVGECTVSCGACERCADPAGYHLCAARTEAGIMRRPGGLATRLLFPARAAHRVPSHVDARDAALVEPLAVAYRGVERLLPAGGADVCVVGAGTIGLLCALVAEALGAPRVHLVDPDEGRRDRATALGFEASTTPPRVPCVVEASGTAEGIRTAVGSTTEGGRVLLLGLTGAPAVPLDVDAVVLRDLTVVGSLGSPSVWPAAVDLVASGRIAPGRLVSHEFGLGRVADAYQRAIDRKPGTHKVLVRPQEVT